MEVFVPDGLPVPEALARVTHLAVGAHQDDLEFMAFHGIASCFHHDAGAWFGGVVCTDGAGCARSGRYAGFSDDAMRKVRIEEQRAAALAGHYAFVAQLGHPSSRAKGPPNPALSAELDRILADMRPKVVYTHSPADKHDTHIGVFAAVLAALRRLPRERRPERLLGCEGWRGLDWLGDAGKVLLDVSGFDHLAAALNGVFDSQIAGGKRYDTAVLGRRAANATFTSSHTTDNATQVCLAMNLTPLLDGGDPSAFTLDAIDRFRADVGQRLRTAFPEQSWKS